MEYCDDPSWPRFGEYLDRRFYLLPPEVIKETVEVRGVRTERTYVFHTPKDDLRMVWQRDANVNTDWCTEHLLKTEDDVRRLLSAPYRFDPPDVQRFINLDESLGENGPMEVLVHTPLFGFAALCKYEHLLEWSVTVPDLIEEAIALRFDRMLKRIEYVLRNGYTGLFILGGAEFAVPPMMSPKQFDAFVVKYDSPLISLIHRYGGLVHVHCHGNVRSVLRKFMDMGADALDPPEPPPHGDVELGEAKRICDGRMTLMGNIEFGDLESGTPSEIEEKVRRAICDGGKERFILYPSSRPISALSDRFTVNAIRYIEVGIKYGGR